MPPNMVSLMGKFFENATLVPLVAVLIAIVLLMSSLRRRLKRRRNEPERDSAVREPPQATASKDRLRRDLESLIVELQELSRRISAEIDTRFAKLEAAMQHADQRIAVLNRLARGETEQAGETAAKGDDHAMRHAVVYELADAGMSPVEIAKEIGRTPGEIEVILNLRRHGGGSEKAGG